MQRELVYRTERQKDRDREEFWSRVMLLAAMVFMVLILTLVY